jgi:hypothetical protein
MSISTAGGIADLVPLEGMPREMARTFADGRSAFVVNRHEEPPVLVCFDRPVQYEAELVHLQEVTGAPIVPGATLSIGWAKRLPFTTESRTTNPAGPAPVGEGSVRII